MESKICNIQKSGKNFILTKVKAGEQYNIVLMDDKNQEVIHFNTGEIFSRYRSYAVDKSEISKEEATFSVENNRVKLTFVVQNANINASFNQTNYNADFYILVKFK